MNYRLSVINMIGTSNDKRRCRCKSWLDHWFYNNKTSSRKICCVMGCNNKIEDGAHVYILDNIFIYKQPYILPFCRSCNHRAEILFIDKRVRPILADYCDYY